MSKLFDPEISKTRKITGLVLSILPSIMLVFSGIIKIIGSEQMLENMAKTNLNEYLLYIGVLEIICVIIFWTPKLSNLGFFLICSYCGGIITAEITAGRGPWLGIIVATLFYVGTFLRKPQLTGLNI